MVAFAFACLVMGPQVPSILFRVGTEAAHIVRMHVSAFCGALAARSATSSLDPDDIDPTECCADMLLLQEMGFREPVEPYPPVDHQREQQTSAVGPG